jgi:uncharacterized protein HemX
VAELEETQQQDVNVDKKVRRSRKGLWVGITVFGFILATAGAGFFLFQQLRDQKQSLTGEVNKGDMKLIELTKQINNYESQIATIQNQLATVQSDVSGKSNHFTKTLADFSQLHTEKLEGTRKQLSSDIQQVQRQLGKTRGDLLVADAEYLLSIANQRLYLIGDIKTTREALEAADERLRESSDAGVFKVREQISKDIGTLGALQAVDVVGIYTALHNLQEHVDKLTLSLPYSGKAIAAPEETHAQPTKEQEKEHTGLVDSAIDQLEGLVTIKHSAHAVKEILTPEEAQFIQEQLRLKVEMVKVALVQQNESLYQLAIADAKAWTEQNFAKNADTGNFVAELDRFNAIKIRSHFPDISLSLKMLRDITKSRSESDKAMQSEPQKAEPVVEPAKPAEPVAPVEAPKPDEAAKAIEPAKATEGTKPVEEQKPVEPATAQPEPKADEPAQKPHKAE